MHHADHVLCLTCHSCWVNVGSFAKAGSPNIVKWHAGPCKMYVDTAFAVGHVFAYASGKHASVRSARVGPPFVSAAVRPVR
jgi:hypothetical protein